MKGVVEGIFVLVGIVCVAVILGCLGGCVALFWRMRRSWGSLPDRKRFGMILGIIGLSGAGYIAGVVAYVWSPLGIRYDYTVSYPAAVYTEDGQKIVFLEHRELSTYALAWTTSQIQESKTYLGVMDKDGRGKRVVGEVPHAHIVIFNESKVAHFNPVSRTVLERWSEKTGISDGEHPNDVVIDKYPVVVIESPNFSPWVVGYFQWQKGKGERYTDRTLIWSQDGRGLYLRLNRQYETNQEKPNPYRPGETYKVWKQEPKMWYLDIRTGEVVVVQQESARIVKNRSALSDLLKIIPDAYTLYPINDPKAEVRDPHRGGSSYFFRPPWWKL